MNTKPSDLQSDALTLGHQEQTRTSPSLTSSGFRILSSVSRLQKQHFNAMFFEWDFFLQPLKVFIQAFVLAVVFVTSSLVMKNSLHLLTLRSIEVFSKQNHRKKVKPQVFFPKVSDYFNSVFHKKKSSIDAKSFFVKFTWLDRFTCWWKFKWSTLSQLIARLDLQTVIFFTNPNTNLF